MHSDTLTEKAASDVTVTATTGHKAGMHKVLFVIDTLQTGGAEQSLFANVIRFKNMQPVVCHLYAGELLKPKFIEHDIRVRSIGLKKKYGFVEAYKRLKAVVEEEQPDIIVAYLTRSEIVARLVARLSHIPVIGTFVSELYSDAYNTSLSAKAKMAVTFFKWANKRTARFCKGFVANSEVVKNANGRALGIDLNKIKVINRGRDSKLFRYQAPQAFPGKPLRFLNVGRLVPVKGQRDMILAFNEFLPACPHAVLHIAGDGPEREPLAALIKELGLQNNVTLLGSRNDVPQLINEYDCFVFPSHSEGFSGAIVEAMFAGLPVLASDIPVNKEVIAHMETGYFFEKGSVQSIKNALLWFTENTAVAHSLAAKANEHARQNFELEKIAEKLEHYLLNMIIEKN